MATLIRKVLTNPVVLNNGIPRLQFVRLAGYWNKDWKPGPYPKTDAERIAAAKKYGLLPQDYEPYPDDGTGLGDYPKLPMISVDQRDPHYNWDEPDLKRNFGEIIHRDMDAYTEERLSNAPRPWDKKTTALYCFSAVGLFIGLAVLFETYKWYTPQKWTKKNFPNSGTVHYTFEPAE